MKTKLIPNKKTTRRHDVMACISIIILFLMCIHSPELGIVEMILSIFFGTICMALAPRKNRNQLVWFALGAWFSFIAIIIILFLKPLDKKICPFCESGISTTAQICACCHGSIIV